MQDLKRHVDGQAVENGAGISRNPGEGDCTNGAGASIGAGDQAAEAVEVAPKDGLGDLKSGDGVSVPHALETSAAMVAAATQPTPLPLMMSTFLGSQTAQVRSDVT